jgi:hypothetical protein
MLALQVRFRAASDVFVEFAIGEARLSVENGNSHLLDCVVYDVQCLVVNIDYPNLITNGLQPLIMTVRIRVPVIGVTESAHWQ